jgi:hypothetical protein
VRWAMGILAAMGLAVVGFVVATAGGFVDLGGLDPFGALNAAAVRPASNPVVPEPAADDPDRASDSEASLAALKHPGYQDQVVYLSAADATVAGPKARLEGLSGGGGDDLFRRRRPGVTAVDPKNKLPNALIRSWASPDDSAEWTFTCPRAGRYAVTFDCIAGVNASVTRGKGVAGGRFTIAAGGETVTADVTADVGGRKWHASSFHLIDVATIDLPAGAVTLTVRPAEKQAGLLSLRSVRIYPATE